MWLWRKCRLRHPVYDADRQVIIMKRILKASIYGLVVAAVIMAGFLFLKHKAESNKVVPQATFSTDLMMN